MSTCTILKAGIFRGGKYTDIEAVEGYIFSFFIRVSMPTEELGFSSEEDSRVLGLQLQ